MADKSPDAQIAEKEAEIEKLKADLKLKAAPKYPKHVRVECKEGDEGALKDEDGKFYFVVEVKNEADEKAASKKGVALPAAGVTGHAAFQKEKDEAEANTRAARSGKR